MQRYRAGAGDRPHVERRRVVLRHRGVVVAVEVIHQLHAGDGETPGPQRDEDPQDMIGDCIHDDHLTVALGLPIDRDVAEGQQPLAVAADRRARIQDMTLLHLIAERRRDRNDRVAGARRRSVLREQRRGAEERGKGR